MAIKISKTRMHPIGVDFGTSQVKLAQVRSGSEGLELQAVCLQDIPAENRTDRKQRLKFVAEFLRETLAERDFKGRESVICLPAADTFVHHIRVPAKRELDLETAVDMELEGKLPFPTADAIIRPIKAGNVTADG